MESKDFNKDEDDEEFPVVHENRDSFTDDIALTECHDFDMESMESFI